MNTLSEQIQRMNNPQEFTKLCNVVFTTKYGSTDYQVIDGTRSDGGNDGYIRSKKALIAMHCPAKPQNMTDAKYREKIDTDLEKAVKLNKGGIYVIKEWVFITPGKLSNDTVGYIIEQAAAKGFAGSHSESIFLATELYEHRGLLPEFPWLQMTDLAADITEIKEHMLKLAKASDRSSKIPPSTFVNKSDPKKQESNEDSKRAIEIIQDQNLADKDKKIQLRTILYKTTNQGAKLNALLGLAQIFMPREEDLNDLLHYCDLGLKVAEKMGVVGASAIFHANRGKYLTQLFAREDIVAACEIQMGNAVGLPAYSESQRATIVQRISSLDDQSKEAFRDAIAAAEKSDDVGLTALIMLEIGNAAGHRFIHLNGLGVKERASKEKALCKTAHDVAKELYASIGYESGIADTLHNLANNLRLFGEIDEAKSLTAQVIQMATKLNYGRLLRKAESLKRRLDTGKIPDYVNGETGDSV